LYALAEAEPKTRQAKRRRNQAKQLFNQQNYPQPDWRKNRIYKAGYARYL